MDLALDLGRLAVDLLRERPQCEVREGEVLLGCGADPVPRPQLVGLFTVVAAVPDQVLASKPLLPAISVRSSL